MTAEELMADLADSAMALRAIVKQLPDQVWRVRVRVLDSAPFPAAGLLIRRLVEVELHHCDLGTSYSPADWPAAFATMELAEPMRSQRQDRLRYPPPPPGAKPAFAGHPPAPWRPGQRLPGSWLGTADESRPLPTSPDPAAIPVRDDRRDPLDTRESCSHRTSEIVALMPNEYFLPAHIYTPDGILTHSLLTLSAITAQYFPSFW
jgi:hypothetical protein